jgi:XTP/dITP diphosphohydrolase
LEVEALDGEPGVYSARYGGEGLSDADRTRLLLETLSQSNSTDRRARFVSVVSIANPRGEIVSLSTGTCEGRIADVARGTNGFGYDPVFVPDGFEESFGELDSYIKEKISHRAKALAEARTFLFELFAL